MTSSRTGEERDGYTVTWVGSLLNLGLIAVKLAAGVWGHSQALIADAIHSLSDLLTDFVALAGLWMGRKRADERHHYGHGRLETLASLVVGLGLIGAALGMGHESVDAILEGRTSHPTWLAAAAALVSIVVKEGLYRYTVAVGRRIHSPVLMANAWHHRSDALSSVAVLAGVSGAILNPDWGKLDSYAALVVAALILKVGLGVMWDAIKEIADTAPQPQVLDDIRDCARGVPGVLDVHDLKARLSAGRYQIQIHVEVQATLTVLEGHRIAKEVEQCLVYEISQLDEIIVHIDPA